MLIGKKCKLSNWSIKETEDIKYTDGVIVSDPLITADGDFIVLVQVADKLIRVDTDFIYGLENKSQ